MDKNILNENDLESFIVRRLTLCASEVFGFARFKKITVQEVWINLGDAEIRIDTKKGNDMFLAWLEGTCAL